MDRIESQRLIIRPFVIDDLEEAHQVLDQDIAWSGPGFDLEQRRRRLQFYIDLAQWNDTGRIYGYRAVVLKASREIIGLAGLHPDCWEPETKAIFWTQLFPGLPADGLSCASLEMGIGYAIATTQRGYGYASEAAGSLIDYAFHELKIARIFAITDRENTASIGVMRKLGMRLAHHPDGSIVYPATAGVLEANHES